MLRQYAVCRLDKWGHVNKSRSYQMSQRVPVPPNEVQKQYIVLHPASRKCAWPQDQSVPQLSTCNLKYINMHRDQTDGLMEIRFQVFALSYLQITGL